MPVTNAVARQIHQCYALKLRNKPRVVIAKELGFTEALVKTRLGQVKAALLNGDIPVNESGLLPLVVDEQESILNEMQRRDNLVYAREGRENVTKLVTAQGILDEVYMMIETQGSLTNDLIQESKRDMRSYLTKLKSKTSSQEVAIQSISDLHHCRYVKGIIEESTTREALFRYGKQAAHLLARQRSHTTIDELVLLLNGDNLHGLANYKAQSQEVSGTFSQQIVRTAMLFIDYINVQRSLYKTIRVYVLGGNHGKKSKDDDLTQENAEFEMGHIIKAYFTTSKDVAVSVIDDNFYTIVPVLGRNYMVTHGDKIAGSGNPQAIIDQFKRWDDILEPFDDCFTGHFHRLLTLNLPTKINTMESRHILVNGTASRGDMFLQGLGSSPSLQWWFTFANHERLTGFFPIDLYERKA